MSSNFFKVKNGLTLDPQYQYGSGDPSDGTDGDIYYNEVLEKFRIFQNGVWVNLASGNEVGTAQEVAIPISTTSIVVTFDTPLPSAVYTILAQMVNVTDADPEFQPITITNKTVSGFTAKWNRPTDTANYLIDYIVAGAQEQMGEAVIGITGTSVTVTLPVPLASSSYVVIGEFVNTVDPTPQFQPVTVTNKTASAFTVSWNAPVDTSNYRLAYQVATYQ
jgi:hypothetical protein